MTTVQRARWTGVIYLVMSLVGAPALLYLPTFVVTGDATATAQKIAAGEQLYRWLVFGDLVSPVLFILLGWSFYRLFEDVDRRLSLLLLAIVTASAVIGIVDVVLLSPPLIFHAHPDWFPALTRSQMDSLALAFLQIRSFEVHANELLWGVWLIPVGILSARSGFIPRLVAAAALVAAAGWILLSAGYIAFPHARAITDRIANPMSQVELVVLLWFLIKGATGPSAAQTNELVPSLRPG